MYHIYILESELNHQYYIGSCENIAKRLRLHNSGKVFSTKRYIPWRVVYSEQFNTRGEAMKRESQIKSWKKRVAIEALIKSYSR